jgi:C4-dicarboxylate-binding protein DctP
VTRVRSAQQLLAKLEPKGIVAWPSGTTASSPSRPTRRSRRRPTSRARRCASSRPRCSKSRCARSAAAAGDGLLRGLSGAADRRGRWHREPDFQPLHAEDARSAEAPDLTDHGYLGYAVIVNKKFWDGLPADVRGSWRGHEGSHRLRQQDRQGRERQGAGGVSRRAARPGLCADQGRAPGLQEGLVPVHQKMEGRIGKEIIQAVYKETGFDPEACKFGNNNCNSVGGLRPPLAHRGVSS